MNELEIRFVEVERTPIMRHYFTVECRTKGGAEFNLPVESSLGPALFAMNQVCLDCPKEYKNFGEVVSAIVVTRRLRRGHLAATIRGMDGYEVVDDKVQLVNRLMA